MWLNIDFIALWKYLLLVIWFGETISLFVQSKMQSRQNIGNLYLTSRILNLNLNKYV